MDFFTRIYVINDAYVKWMKKVCGCILFSKSANRLQIKNHGLKDDQSLALGESILADVIVFIFTH